MLILLHIYDERAHRDTLLVRRTSELNSIYSYINNIVCGGDDTSTCFSSQQQLPSPFTNSKVVKVSIVRMMRIIHASF